MALYRESEESLCKDYKLSGPVRNFQGKKTQIDIVPTQEFQDALFLDGELQLTLRDEYIYHEMLVHPAMTMSPSNANVLILGGGDGCAAREVLRWHNVKSVTIVDWDSEVLNQFYIPFSQWNSKSLQSEKVSVVISDVLEFEPKGNYDVIFVDLVDPSLKDPLSKHLWETLIPKLASFLSPNTSLVLNAGGFYPWNTSTQEWILMRIVGSCFHNTTHSCQVYKTFVPSFGREWCFFFLYPSDLEPNLEILSPSKYLRYCNKDAWTLATTWTKDLKGSLPTEPVKLKGYLPRL